MQIGVKGAVKKNKSVAFFAQVWLVRSMVTMDGSLEW